ncbi:MAG: hypothetical protein L0Y79_12700 [Chlorobi bacterium]|nr:hypothetical protein [Chlorobiota bacterium]
MPKTFIYIIWGLNAVIFLDEDIIFKHFVTDSYQQASTASFCTVLKKVKSEADLTQNVEIVKSNEFVAIFSHDYELVKFDVILNHSSRGPPFTGLSA